jgi:hypothetical protein
MPRRCPATGLPSGSWCYDPGEDVPDGRAFTRPWPASPAGRQRDQVTCCQHRPGRARRALRGIDEQAAKADKAVAGTCHKSGGKVLCLEARRVILCMQK